MPALKTKQKGGDEPLLKKEVIVPHPTLAAGRAVRIAVYPPNKDRNTTEPTVTMGMGNASYAYNKTYVELTPDIWKQIQAAVRDAFRAAEQAA